MKNIREILEKNASSITNDTKRNKLQFKLVYMIFAIVALIMSITNIFTEQWVLFFATISFSILCLIDLILLTKVKNGLAISKYIFEVETLALFTYFIITGGTNGFSIIWVLLLPSCGMLFFGRKNGSIFSTILFVEMCLFLHAGFSFVYEYNSTFVLRFPLVYGACFCVALILETIRAITHRELVILQKKYANLYTHDALTDTYNRYGFNDAIDELSEQSDDEIVGFGILDIDNFKNVNDTYGHFNGDIVLKDIALIIKETLGDNAQVYRWGGEEFAILFKNCNKDTVYNKSEELRKQIENKIIKLTDNQTVSVTVSIGLIITYCMNNKSELEKNLYAADKYLYDAKNDGKNCIKFYDYTK